MAAMPSSITRARQPSSTSSTVWLLLRFRLSNRRPAKDGCVRQMEDVAEPVAISPVSVVREWVAEPVATHECAHPDCIALMCLGDLHLELAREAFMLAERRVEGRRWPEISTGSATQHPTPVGLRQIGLRYRIKVQPILTCNIRQGTREDPPIPRRRALCGAGVHRRREGAFCTRSAACRPRQRGPRAPALLA